MSATVRPLPNGPLMVRGAFEVLGASGKPIVTEQSAGRVLLCRCGNSANKPLCDGSHRRAGTGEPGAVALRPRFEGANIRTWIGFKHFMYLVEEAVLDWFRSRDLGPATLFREHGLTLSIADSSVQLPAVIDLDDALDAEVTGGPARFKVRLRVRRPGGPTALRGKVTVALTRVGSGVADDEPRDAAPLPAVLAGAVGELAEPDVGGRADLVAETDPEPVLAGCGDFVWSWRVPYYYCQFSDRIQHSGYVRAVEEVVDRFLADRGLSVRTMLDRRGWVPVVSRVRVTQLVAAHMEETVYTRVRVVDVVRDSGFDASIDFYAHRGATLVHTAAARILHGYAISRGPLAGRLAQLDPATVAALTRTSPAGIPLPNGAGGPNGARP